MTSHPKSKDMLCSQLFIGKIIAYNCYGISINIATMFGFVKNQNGVKNAPMEQELLLSDVFFDSTGKENMELKVKVFNINSNKAHKILDKCQILKEYSIFIDKVREYRKKVVKVQLKTRLMSVLRMIYVSVEVGKNHTKLLITTKSLKNK